LNEYSCVALSGGVGGAKLALGLSHAMDPARLLLVANTGDDFEHLGLHISPDIDTLIYTLAGLANPETGWGRAGETWSFMDALAQFGGETWFRLGDRDLALHVERTRRLRAGEGLADVTDAIRRQLAIAPTIVPMSDHPVRTIVETRDGLLAFQHYFVRDQCRPSVTGFHFEGAAAARPADGVLAAIRGADLVVICPSNPFISIDPILAVPGIRNTLMASTAPIIAVSPIVGGRAIKGPTAKMMTELGLDTTAAELARHYRGLIDGFVLDDVDRDAVDAVERQGCTAMVTNTVMNSLSDRVSLARAVIAFAGRLRES
jgi:LPPG:FO 2-phospho-L-lactate transferase